MNIEQNISSLRSSRPFVALALLLSSLPAWGCPLQQSQPLQALQHHMLEQEPVDMGGEVTRFELPADTVCPSVVALQGSMMEGVMVAGRLVQLTIIRNGDETRLRHWLLRTWLSDGEAQQPVRRNHFTRDFSGGRLRYFHSVTTAGDGVERLQITHPKRQYRVVEQLLRQEGGRW